MRKLFLALAIAIAGAAAQAASPAATMDWVRMYVATNNVTVVSNGTSNVYATGTGSNAVSITAYPAKVRALVTYDCADGAPYTNGMTFAYITNYAVYANVPADLTIAAGFSYNAASNAVVGFCSYPDYDYYSTNINNQTWLYDGTNLAARLVSTLISEAAALSLTNGFVFAEEE